MRRAPALLSVVFAALAVAAAPAGAATPRHALGFELHADGFWVTAMSPLAGERVRLMLDRHGEVAYYWAPARIGPDSVRVRFGRLGALAFRFTPGRGEGPLGCGGRHDGSQWGTFRGSLVFRGERHYADVDARRARGWMQTRPSGCRGGRPAGGEGEVRRAGASRPAPVAETGAVLEATTASVLPADVFYSFLDHGPKGLRVVFGALREERREGMRIERGAQVYGGAAAFRWDLGAGTAVLRPPGPFEGRAVYRRQAHGKASWTGSLRVPVLGARRPMRLAGAAFDAHLRADT
ncbi:MAG TPA: hypothetical protein VHA76_07015 [Solirubrobacterales bacterium]|nr:hypothetical protein [Solirubrobacterales bacterium]